MSASRGADIFVLAFSLISRASYENVLKKRDQIGAKVLVAHSWALCVEVVLLRKRSSIDESVSTFDITTSKFSHVICSTIIQNAEDVDQCIPAKLPDQTVDPGGYKMVSERMMHSPCGLENILHSLTSYGKKGITECMERTKGIPINYLRLLPTQLD
nr:DNA helicase [Tanacetum cinerariifolium]